MFEIGQHYLFFVCDHPDEGVGQQGGKVIAVDGPLIKVERVLGVEDIINTYAPQFVRAEKLNFDPALVNDDLEALLASPSN